MTPDALQTRIARARAPGLTRQRADLARRILTDLAARAAAAGQDGAQVLSLLADGMAAAQVAQALLAQRADPPGLDCRTGCAFCCILAGQDGALVTRAEARRVHAALTPLAGLPDGRAWHPRACAALDPETRTCRAYAARPTICRSYVSTDAAACETVAQGGTAPGPGLIGDHLTYLAVHALARAALRGVAAVPTYSLAAMTAAAVAGVPVETALKEARHAPKVLEGEVRRTALGQ